MRLTLDRAGEKEPPEEILDTLGLLQVADRYPRDLSTGERQRAALAAVLPGSPGLPLLDAPTRGMDTAARNAPGLSGRWRAPLPGWRDLLALAAGSMAGSASAPELACRTLNNRYWDALGLHIISTRWRRLRYA